MNFSVWAPDKARVDLLLGAERLPMSPSLDRPGYWEASVDDPLADGDYAFSLDGGDPLPDPRAPRLPNGVHSRGRLVNPQSFAWTDQSFRARPLSSAVLYELHLGTFSPEGTFAGAVERLDHLVELGITHVALMPVHSFSGRHGWGYDSVGLFAPHEPYGGPDGLWRLVNACHGKGLAVIADVVYNHLGPDGNYLGQFAPYFTERVKTPWGAAVNFDGPGSDEVRTFFIDNARMWLRDYHFDGLRLDATHAYFDMSATHFLEELSEAVDLLEAQVGRPLILIAETDRNDPRTVLSRDAGGYGMNAQWNDELHHVLHAWMTGENQGYYADYDGSAESVARCLERGFLYDGAFSEHRGRRHGRPVHELPSSRFITYLQTHDQVGNRAQGDRISHLVSRECCLVGTTIVFFATTAPMLFAGEEWAASTPFPFFTDFDEGLGKLVREGRRGEFAAFGWAPEDVPDPQLLDTFESAKLDWTELSRAPHAEVHRYYQALIALRHQKADLRVPRFEHLDVEVEGPMSLRLRRGSLELLAHIGADEHEFSRPSGTIVLSTPSGPEERGDMIHLGGPGAVIIETAGS